MQSLLTLNKLWLVVMGKNTIPVASSDAFTKELEIFDQKLLEWKDHNARAVALIRLGCEAGPKIHIRGMEAATAVWAELKKQYEGINLATLDLALQSICRSEQVKFGSIEEYDQNLKQNAVKCSEMGYEIPNWLLESLFRMGLPTVEINEV